jgi:cold shock CspA family protein
MCRCLTQRYSDECQIRGEVLQTVVKKWFRDKDSGFLDNGGGKDIRVRKADLVNCQFLKVGAIVEFECHTDNQGLMAKKVKLIHQKKLNGQHNGGRSTKEYRPGVMT